MFSIVFTSFADFGYTKLLIDTIEENTTLPYEIIVHDNTSNDTVGKYLEEKNILRTCVGENIGPSGVNYALKKAKYKYGIILNDDMCALPNWDIELKNQINTLVENGVDNFLISCKLIQSSDQYFCHKKDYGNSFENYKRSNIEADTPGIVEEYRNDKKVISFYQPQVFVVDKYLESGGMIHKAGSCAEHSVAANLWNNGCKIIFQLNTSLFYHFNKKSGGIYNGGVTQEDMCKQLKISKFSEWMSKIGHGKQIDLDSYIKEKCNE